MSLIKILVLILFTALLSCQKDWEPPTINTVNLSLAANPDSIDAAKTYYYSDGMKLQIRLIIKSEGNVVKDEVWTDQANFHWTDTLSSASITGKVVNLSSDTTLSIENYPVYMKVYQGSDVLYEKLNVENNYSF